MPLSKHGIADPPIWGHKSSLEKQFMWPQGNAQDLPVVEASLGFCIQCAMTQFEPNDFWFQTNSFVHPLKHQLFRPRATALMKADEGKARQDKTNHLANLRPGRELTWEVAVNHLLLPATVSQRAVQQLLCRFPSALAVAASFWNCLQLLLYFCSFPNYTLPFEYNICFKYLENANFFIYTCLKKLWLCCVP